MENEETPFLIAPTVNDNEYVEYRIKKSVAENENCNWKVHRTTVNSVKPSERRLLVSYPSGSLNQDKVPSFLRNMTILDSRRIQKMPKRDIFFDLLGPLLREFGIYYVYVATTSSESIMENAKSFTNTTTLALLGGDTSLHEFVNALPNMETGNYNVKFLMIPTGSGNALANSVGLNSPIEAIQRLFLAKSDDFKPLSSFKVQFPHVSVQALVVASWGLHSALVADADTLEMREKYEDPSERFQQAGKFNLNDFLQVYRSNGKTHSYLLFTCVTYLEKSFLISPFSEPPSGTKLFKLQIKSYESIETQAHRLKEIIMNVYNNGKHVEYEEVDYKEVQGTEEVRVDSGQDEKMRRWCVDGKIIVSPPGVVEIGEIEHQFNGWDLLILTA